MKVITEVINHDIFQATFTLRDSESGSKQQHTHTLNEVQRRAYQVHQRHGGIYGGYTLEDWLKAEHELDEEDDSPSPKNDQVH
jgi:Protein of unknown function (DUF2934)